MCFAGLLIGFSEFEPLCADLETSQSRVLVQWQLCFVIKWVTSYFWLSKKYMLQLIDGFQFSSMFLWFLRGVELQSFTPWCSRVSYSCASCCQCEREYHVGCLKKHGLEDLKVTLLSTSYFLYNTSYLVVLSLTLYVYASLNGICCPAQHVPCGFFNSKLISTWWKSNISWSVVSLLPTLD